MNAESQRLHEASAENIAWKKWGPYLSERQWGTVREDYSEAGNAWDYFSHDQSRSRAYRWGEDGIAGVSDDKQRLCFALALWNERDPILKERLFGLTNSEGNHGEDVKEYYFYLDSTPTHSYMKYLYKYPQAPFPYSDLVLTNRGRSRGELEYELINTGAFDGDRYFDVFVEYAKQAPDDLLVRITVHNRGPEAAPLRLLPTLWFRNTWSWGPGGAHPELRAIAGEDGTPTVLARHEKLGEMVWHCPGAAELMFTENETNSERIFGHSNGSPYAKDAFHRAIIEGRTDLVNPAQVGTKVAAHYRLMVPAGGSQVVQLRLRSAEPTEPSASANGAAPANGVTPTNGVTPANGAASTNGAVPAHGAGLFGRAFDALFDARIREADEFYDSITPKSLDADRKLVMRQALAGMLWSKQFYYFDVDQWLGERGSDPLSPMRKLGPRNDHWHHMFNADVISMPDKWEYPWYAAWDLAFHVLALSLVDRDLAKQQLELVLRERYIHPNGQIPAYEWNFGDVNPPVHAWATIFTYLLDKGTRELGDIAWLKRSFDKLLLNFTWWVNRKDRSGHNVFEGGFLGLDNIGVFDRSSALPTGGYLEQADGTAWMALYCQNMLQISLELASDDEAYREMSIKFAQHFLWIASAMTRLGGQEGMWDEEDGFFYDVLRLPDGSAVRLKVRSMVGLLPLCAATVFHPEKLDFAGDAGERFRQFLAARPELITNIHDPRLPGVGNRRMLSIVGETRLRRILSIFLDEREFLSPYGIRSLSRRHAEEPYVLNVGGREYRVDYLPAESDSGMFGGNSNWRGPIWMPVNVLLIRALLNYHLYYGDEFKVECPTGSGKYLTLFEVAHELGRRLESIFTLDDSGRRAVFGGVERFQNDPLWRDLVPFYEYFHGDNGAGLGASHQTGWTGTIARVMHIFASVRADDLGTAEGKGSIWKAMTEPQPTG